MRCLLERQPAGDDELPHSGAVHPGQLGGFSFARPVGVRAGGARVPAAQRQNLDVGAGQLPVLPPRSACQLTCGDELADSPHMPTPRRRLGGVALASSRSGGGARGCGFLRLTAHVAAAAKLR
jgi:hypothetical protein